MNSPGTSQLIFHFSCLTLLVLATSACQTSKPWAGMDPEEIPSLMKEEFEIKEGMSRSQVEEVLGFPAQVGRSKEGYPFAQYEYSLRVRHVVYDFDDNVLVAYPY